MLVRGKHAYIELSTFLGHAEGIPARGKYAYIELSICSMPSFHVRSAMYDTSNRATFKTQLGVEILRRGQWGTQ
jgi:hypothetical protein